MPQYLIPPGKSHGEAVSLSGEEVHHLQKVLRKKAGDRIQLSDGIGQRFSGRILEINNEQVLVQLEDPLSDLQLNGQITLIHSLIKGERMDWSIQKAAELGVHAFIPLITKRSVVKWDDDKADKKLARWQSISQAASKQCGRSQHMQVNAPMTISELRKNNDAVKILFWENAKRSCRDFLKEQNFDQATHISVLVGPEGGLEEGEVKCAEAAGFVPLSLGSIILRAETASLAAVTLLQYELGNM
jgi:16S rRNA (uracil1498-N3)-methyltransferase